MKQNYFSFTKVLLVATICVTLSKFVTSQDWYDSNWQYRRPILISNPGGTVLTDYQVLVTLNNSFDFTKAKIDGSDIRITGANGTILVHFWIEKWDAAGLQAAIWIKIPDLPVSGAIIYMYYGNSAAIKASSGSATFEFFDDFESPIITEYGYFNISETPTTLLNVSQGWETSAPHTFSVVELNQDGYQYWGYYSLELYPGGGSIGLARSNDLVNWVKYESNPVITGQLRWASAIKVGTSLYMGYTKYTGVSSIVLAVSQEGSEFGTSFTELKTLVPPEVGFYNGSPNFFLNPNDGLYYMYYVRINTSSNYRDIMVRYAENIEDLDIAPGIIVASSATVFSAPNMLYYEGTYYLTVETNPNGIWQTEAWASNSPISGFNPLPGNPVLGNGAACWFQHIFGTTLHIYYAKQTGTIWTMEYRYADLTEGRIEYQVPGPLDPAKWTPSGGLWTTTISTQQDGTTGIVAQGATSAHQILQSIGFSGTDYIADVYGQQLLGPEWGLCTRVSSSNNFYASLLYDNHDETDNLYTYNWMPASHPVIGKTALGTINPNTWYRMTVKVHDDSIITSINGIAKLKLQNSQHTSGGVAFFGESGTKAQLNDLRVRKYTVIEPTISVGDENQVAQSLSLKAFLEGPFDGIEMNTNLNDYSILSLVQPYNTDPWNYTGTESVSEIPNPNVVDWVLVEIRDAEEAASATTATRVARQAALLLKDGRIVGLDGISNIQFNTPIIHQLFVVIWHRNHLGIISANSLIPGPGGLYSYDFTSTISQAYGDGQINLGNSFFGMIAGDANADGIINLSDGIQTWIPQVGTTGYLNGDLNLNAQVNNPDKNDQWLKNLTMESQIPE